MNSHCLLCFNDLDEGISLVDWFFENDCLCGKCRAKLEVHQKLYHIGSLTIYAYYLYNDELETIIYQYKEGRDVALAPIFFMKAKQILIDKYRHYTLVPMPSNQSKIKERGFHHLLKMLEDIPLPICNCLTKNKEYKQSLRRGSNRQDIGEVLALDETVEIAKTPLLLIDDVVTSGATLKAAYDLLAPFNSNIVGFVLSVHPHFVELCDGLELKDKA